MNSIGTFPQPMSCHPVEEEVGVSRTFEQENCLMLPQAGEMSSRGQALRPPFYQQQTVWRFVTKALNFGLEEP